ncbi:MAG: hypothetical protein ACXABY_09010 [Candidatus Thorarchaeota archaeon]|jgi:hypothetical protein
MLTRTASDVDVIGLHMDQIKVILTKVGPTIRYSRSEDKIKCRNFGQAREVREMRNAMIREDMRKEIESA